MMSILAGVVARAWLVSTIAAAAYRIRSKWRRRAVENIYISLWIMRFGTRSTRRIRGWISGPAAATWSVLEARLQGDRTESSPIMLWHPLFQNLSPEGVGQIVGMIEMMMQHRFGLIVRCFKIEDDDTSKPTLH